MTANRSAVRKIAQAIARGWTPSEIDGPGAFLRQRANSRRLARRARMGRSVRNG
jgi:hypothetical protein